MNCIKKYMNIVWKKERWTGPEREETERDERRRTGSERDKSRRIGSEKRSRKRAEASRRSTLKCVLKPKPTL